jgi:hypothetical protein
MMEAKRSRKGREPKRDAFAEDPVGGEYEKPGPRMDPDAAAIATVVSELKKRANTGVVLRWRPGWLKGDVQPFSFYLFEDKLAIDFFNRDVPKGAELDALADDITPAQRAEVVVKSSLCAQHGLAYMALGPDDELDRLQIAAKLGVTTVKKGARPARTMGGDGYSEEEC